MVTASQKNILFIGGGLVVLLLFLTFTGILKFPTAALLAYSSNVMFNTSSGMYQYSFATLSIDKSQGTTFLLAPQNQPLQNGSTLVAGRNVTVGIAPALSGSSCNYSLTPNYGPIVFGYNFNLYKYYTVGAAGLHVPLWITSNVNKNPAGNPIVYPTDASHIGEVTTITDPQSGGTLTVQNQGSFSAQYTCPPPTGVYAIDVNDTPIIVDATQYNQQQTNTQNNILLVCGATCGVTGTASLTCRNCIANGFSSLTSGAGLTPVPSYSICSNPNPSFYNANPGLYFGDPSGTLIHSSLTCQIPQSSIANPVVTITGDQKYFSGFIYNVPQVSMPQILTTTVGDFSGGISQGQGFSVIVKNGATFSDTYTYTITPNFGTVTPSSGSVTLNGGDQSLLQFQYAVPSVTSNTPYSITVKVCSNSQISSQCATKTLTGNINYVAPPSPIPIPGQNTTPTTPYCGDGICQANRGESTTTCPVDCPASTPTPGSCPVNSQVVNGQCICNGGYQRAFDQTTGAMSCNVPADWTQYLPWVAIGIAVVAVGYAVLTRKKGGRRK